MQKKIITLAKLETFLESLRGVFSPIKHTHTTSDISDYKVDTILSSTSNNPISSKAVYSAQNSKIDSALEDAREYADNCTKVVIKTWGTDD